MQPRAVVVVGSGQAGFQVAASLRDSGFDGRVTIVGEEDAPCYQRPPLSKRFLCSDDGAESVHLRPPEFYAQEAIDLVSGVRVVRIDRDARSVHLSRGGPIGFDHLVLATGTRARTLPLPGSEGEGVMSLRTLADAQALRLRLREAKRVAIIGAGFIGLELAAACRTLRVGVHLVEAAGRPMQRLVSARTAAYFDALHRAWGAGFSYGAGAKRIERRNGCVDAVVLTDDTRIDADLVVIAVGAQPNVELASLAGLAVEDGVAVDAMLATCDPAISAVGDCARFPSSAGRLRLESVQNAVDQARCVAARIAGKPAPYARTPWFWSDQGSVRLQIAGIAPSHDREVLRGDPASGGFSLFCYREGALVAVESVNRPVEHIAARKLLAEGRALSCEQAGDASFDVARYAAGRAG